MLGKFTLETYRTTMSCSFLSIVGGICGGVDRTSSSTSVTPLTQCKRDIKKSLKFSGVEKEVELFLAGCGCLLEMTICPAHRASIGIGWRRTSNVLHHPGSCFGSLELRKVTALEKGINLFQSRKILELSNQLIPVG